MSSCSVSSLPLSLSRQGEGEEESESAAETEGWPAAVGAGRSLPSSSSNRAHLRPNSSSHRRLQLLLPLHVWALILLLLCPLFFLLLANSTTLALPGLSVLRMSSNGQQAQQQLPLRVMTFNIWVSGANVHNGMDKIASQILDVDPDIVALQEVRTAEVATNLTQLLGPSKWKSAHHPFAAYPDTAILTKHKFVLEKEFVHLQFERNISDFLFNEEHYMNNSVITYGMGATIELEPSGQLVNFVSLHLDWRAYGPYAANNKLVTSQKQIMAGERNKQGYGRAQNIEQMLADEGFQRYLHVADQQPLIVAGDFNAPSHLDWTEETKDIHGGWAFEWPSSKLLADAGFHDSFRKIHPDIKKEPGITWSTVQKSVGPDWDWTVPEPQDRIDLILYKPSSKFRPLHSYTYAGKGPLKPIPEQFDNEWPSDHYAVVTEFAVDEPAAVNGEQKLVN